MPLAEPERIFADDRIPYICQKHMTDLTVKLVNWNGLPVWAVETCPDCITDAENQED